MLRFLSLLGLVCMTSAALADVVTLPEPGTKRVPQKHRVKLGKEIPGYKFYTYSGQVGPVFTIDKELQLDTKNDVVVPGSSSASRWAGVVAVPQQLMDELQSAENLGKMLSAKSRAPLPAGVVVHRTGGADFDIPEKDPRPKVENMITISPDENSGVVFTAKQMPGPSIKAPSSSAPPTGNIFAGVALAVAAFAGGLWWFRRGKPAAP